MLTNNFSWLAIPSTPVMPVTPHQDLSPADLPVVLQHLILQYVDNCTFADLIDWARGDDHTLAWLKPLCNEEELDIRQKRTFPVSFMRKTMRSFDVVYSVIHDLPMYKIDLEFAMENAMFWDASHVEGHVRYEAVRQFLIRYMDPYERLGMSGSVGIEWIRYINGMGHGLGHPVFIRDRLLEIVHVRANLRASISIRNSVHAQLSAEEYERVVALIAPTLDRYIWSRAELYHHSYISEQDLQHMLILGLTGASSLSEIDISQKEM